MSGKILKKLNLLDKTQLVKIAKQLEIIGISRKKKEEIKQLIIQHLKKTKVKIENINLKPVVNRIQPSIPDNNTNTSNTQSDTQSNTQSDTQSNTQSNIPNNTLTKIQKLSRRNIHTTNIPNEPTHSNSNRCVYPKVKKLVAIGDLHGDLVATIKALKLAGVIDPAIPSDTQNINSINWSGKDTYVVQLGDQIDRVRPASLFNNMCPENDPDIYEDEGSDLKIICLFNRLHAQAKKVNGACFSILGNHELMNVDGDFRYVSPREFREFGNFFKASKSLKNNQFPYGYKERKLAFAPGGVISKKLADTRYSVLQVGGWVFVHGGITPSIAQKYSLKDMNAAIKMWLKGNITDNVRSAVNDLYHNEDDDEAIFWSRVYSDLDDYNNECESKFHSAIELMNKKNKRTGNDLIRGMILGHSPQYMYNKGINSACDNRLWRVDIGMSRALGPLSENTPEGTNRKVQILVIENDNKFHIIREK